MKRLRPREARSYLQAQAQAMMQRAPRAPVSVQLNQDPDAAQFNEPMLDWAAEEITSACGAAEDLAVSILPKQREIVAKRRGAIVARFYVGAGRLFWVARGTNHPVPDKQTLRALLYVILSKINALPNSDIYYKARLESAEHCRSKNLPV